MNCAGNLFDLSPAALATVRAIFSRHIQTGTAKPYSDLDLAVLGDTAMPARTYNQLI